jgi:hypothetical protein
MVFFGCRFPLSRLRFRNRLSKFVVLCGPASHNRRLQVLDARRFLR